MVLRGLKDLGIHTVCRFHMKLKETDIPSHEGPFKGAIDFLVALGTPVLASRDGMIVDVIDAHDKFGPTEEYKEDLNYITLLHENGEYSQLAHLARGSAMVSLGEDVKVGQEIGISGNSGWMTEPQIHMLVFRLEADEHGFKGLEIRFEE